jgi:RHS repeat-associated protein
VVESLAVGYTVAPSGALFTSPFSLVASLLTPKSALGKNSCSTLSGTPNNLPSSSDCTLGYCVRGYDIALTSAEYVYRLERISQERGGVDHWYLADGQRSVRQLADSNAFVSDTYGYTAFGEPLASTGSTANEFRYVGEQADPNSGFYYLRARWMDPGTGRFASIDPFAGDRQTPISLHRYLYANASPVSFTDPSGEAPLTDFIRVASRFLGRYAVPTVLGTFIHQRLCEDIRNGIGPGNVGCFDAIPGVGVPDVVLRPSREVYEIKPEGGRQGPESQLVRYTNGTGLIRGVTPISGTVHSPAPIFVMDVEYYTAGPGEIYYIPRINRNSVAASFSAAAAYSIQRITTMIVGRLAIPTFGFAF